MTLERIGCKLPRHQLNFFRNTQLKNLALCTFVHGTARHRLYERRTSASDSWNTCWKHFSWI